MTTDYLIRGTAANHTLRVLAVDSTILVSETQQRHDLGVTATAALGRLMTGAVLFAYTLTKHKESRVTLRIQGDGPIGYLVAEGTAQDNHASARGYVHNPKVDLPLREIDQKIDVGGLIGQGDLSVMRILENAEPYTSTVSLVSGEIAQDLAQYLAESEQIPSAVLLGVYLEGQQVRTAGGVLVQAMPEVSDGDLDILEANIAGLGNLTSALRDSDLQTVVARITEGLGFEPLEDPVPVNFKCRCSRERLLATLGYFSDSERQDMIDSGGQEAVCHWCNTTYQLTSTEIADLQEKFRRLP